MVLPFLSKVSLTKMGKVAVIGAGGSRSLRPSPDMIHDQQDVFGSWVTSIWLMEDLLQRIVRC